MSHTAGKKRTVIVSHPEFDKFGVAGIQESKRFAETLIDGQKQMIAMAERSGEAPDQIAKVKKYVQDFTIVIRSIDDEII